MLVICHHISSDLVLSIQFLEVLLRPLLVRVGPEVCLHKVVHNVVLTDTLNMITTLEGEREREIITNVRLFSKEVKET